MAMRSGMDVAASFRNGSKNVPPNGKNGRPNPSYYYYPPYNYY